MKPTAISLLILCSIKLFGQASNGTDNTAPDKWKAAIVKIESIQQRYNFEQVDALLQKQTEGVKGLSQHAKYNTQGELLTIRDTIRGTGILIADGTKIYLVTSKHLIKATENAANGSETINDLISIKSNIKNNVSNDISLTNLAENKTNLQPFVFSPDVDDIGIISFQKKAHKEIVAYLKQVGCKPVPVGLISNLNDTEAGENVLMIGFAALPGKAHNDADAETGKIISNEKGETGFTIGSTVYPGFTGAPVIYNDKLIGILSFQTGISTNIDAAVHPYDKTSAATVIKAWVIIPLLKKLQEHERNGLF